MPGTQPADPVVVTTWNRTAARIRALAGLLGLVLMASSATALATPARAEEGVSRHAVTVVAARWDGVGGEAVAPDVVAQVAALVDGPVDAAWSADTGGAVRFVAAGTHDWVDLSAPACRDGRVADIGSIWSQVVAATGWTEAPRAHLVVVTPRVDCGGAEGVATMAGVGVDRSGLVWVNGVPSAAVLAHELGHNLGLNHSNTLSCVVEGVRVTDADASQCTSHEYMDLTDVMGISHQHIGALNPVHLARLGLLDAAQVIDIDVATVGEFTLPTYASAQRRVLRLRTATATYYIVYRSAFGRDAWLSEGGGFGDPGIAIYKSVSSGSLNPTVSYLLDAHVASADADLAQARTVLDPGVSVRLAGEVQVSAIGLDVQAARVWIGPQPQPVATPQVVAPPQVVVLAPPPPVVMPPVPPAPSEAPQVREDDANTHSDAHAPKAPAAPEEASTASESPVSVPTSQDDAPRVVVHDAPTVDVQYGGEWSTRAWRDARQGRVHVTTTSGATVRLQVTGLQLRILGVRSRDYGRLVVRVDGTRVAVVDLEGRRSSPGAVSAWISLGSHGLHTVVLVARGDGPIVFDGVQVRQANASVTQ